MAHSECMSQLGVDWWKISCIVRMQTWYRDKCYIETCLDDNKHDSECWDGVRQRKLNKW